MIKLIFMRLVYEKKKKINLSFLIFPNEIFYLSVG